MAGWYLSASPRRLLPTAFFSDADLSAVRHFYRTAPRTSLCALPGLARSLGFARLLVKDESARSDLGAFKIVGARFAIDRLLRSSARRIGHLACATAGNHGRAVARVAREAGLMAHVYLPRGTATATIEALRADNADVVITDTGYDDTVTRMARDAGARGWTIVSDTAWPGHETVPRLIMAGYTHIVEEAAVEWGDRRPDLVIVQAGVGSFATAVAAWLAARYGSDRPALIVAEPDGSACVLASLQAGRQVALAQVAPTAMVGLRCAEVSTVAWPILERLADAAIAVPEALALETLAGLAAPLPGDPAIVAGPSGACGIAALIRLAQDPALAPVRSALGLNRSTSALAFVTEAAR